jgi:hypothetical protein
MSAMDRIEADWPVFRRLREALIADDPYPELSRLDRLDGLGGKR